MSLMFVSFQLALKKRYFMDFGFVVVLVFVWACMAGYSFVPRNDAGFLTYNDAIFRKTATRANITQHFIGKGGSVMSKQKFSFFQILSNP